MRKTVLSVLIPLLSGFSAYAEQPGPMLGCRTTIATRIIGKVDFCVAVRATGFLGAFDAEKIAFLPYEAVMEVFSQNDFNWNVPPSADAGYNERLAALKAAMKRLSARIEPKVYEYGFFEEVNLKGKTK